MISRFFNIMKMLTFHDMVNLFDPELSGRKVFEEFSKTVRR